VYEIKPDNRAAIALGRVQMTSYLGTLATRYPSKPFIPGEWNPGGPYAVNDVWGIPGFSFTFTTRNAGYGIIAYKTDPSPELLTFELELAFQVAKIGLTAVAEGAETVGDVVTATALDTLAGVPF
jgi:hypothetical protein